MFMKRKVLSWWYTYPNRQFVKALLFWIIISGIIAGIVNLIKLIL